MRDVFQKEQVFPLDKKKQPRLMDGTEPEGPDLKEVGAHQAQSLSGEQGRRAHAQAIGQRRIKENGQVQADAFSRIRQWPGEDRRRLGSIRVVLWGCALHVAAIVGKECAAMVIMFIRAAVFHRTDTDRGGAAHGATQALQGRGRGTEQQQACGHNGQPAMCAERVHERR